MTGTSTHGQLSSVKIVYCITELDPGGAERALFQLVKWIDRDQFQPTVISLQSGGVLSESIRDLGIPVHELGMTSLSGLPKTIWSLKQILRDIRPQIVHGFLFHANLVSRLSAKLAGVPIVINGIRVAERRSRGYLWMDRMTSGLVDQYICVSESVAQFTIQHGGIPSRKVRVIPNGVDPSEPTNSSWSRSSLGIAQDDSILLFVGRLDRQKGIDELVEAIPLLLDLKNRCHLVCTGIGPLEDTLKSRVSDLGLTERVHFLGYQNDVRGLYQLADLLVLPSRWEGMPNVGIPEIRQKTDGIFTISEVKAATIAQSVRNALEAVERRKRDAGCSQVLTFQWDTWKDVAVHYEACYHELLSRRQQSDGM